jgi:hypothetical protein
MDDSVRDLLGRSGALGGEPALIDASARLFDFVQFLLDDDENLTPAGNLTGKAKEKLRQRVNELLDGAEAPE